VITRLGLPSLSKSQASTRQAAMEKGDRGWWSRGLAEQARLAGEREPGPNILWSGYLHPDVHYIK
jgi:hypothetical protein